MKVSDLARLLQNIAEGLQPIVAAGVVSDLMSLRSAMAPFADRAVADFTKFLAQCEEFARTGVVSGARKSPAKGASKPASDPARVDAAAESVRALLREIDRGSVDSRRIEQVLQPLDGLGKPDIDKVLAALEIVGSTRSKKQGLDKLRTMITNQAEAGTRVRTMGEYR